MIIKATQRMEWDYFIRRSKLVKALHMRQDFLVECAQGWVQGKRGDWLVEVAPGMRFPADDKWFQMAYKPWKRKIRQKV
jgi:hypothetical protein